MKKEILLSLFSMLLSACFILLSVACYGQVKIGANPSSINSFSLLELESTDKGLLLPRIQTATGLALMSGAPDGMTVYFVPDESIYIKRSTGWIKVNSNWVINGNNISNENTGNVGIGTTTPSNTLTVKSDPSGIGISQEDGTGAVRVGFYTALGGAYVQTHSNHDLNFATGNGVSRMILKTNGNVGINISSPADKLDVGGNIHLSGEVNKSSTGTANLLPFAYGKIVYDGVFLTATGTGNFSATRTGTGLFEITLGSEPNVYANQASYMVLVTVEASSTKMTSVSFLPNNSIQIRTAQPKVNYTNTFCSSCNNNVFSYITTFSASENEDNTFSFLIYKL